MVIIPKSTCLTPGWTTPRFVFPTDGGRYFSVQIATDPMQFNGSLSARFGATMFWDSRSGAPPATGRRPASAVFLPYNNGVRP